MKFRTDRPGFVSESVYETKNRKLAESIMALHRGLGDGIVILEDDDDDDSEA